jgi:enoyl-[acyl-carrier-protein] reductase (NADH)
MKISEVGRVVTFLAGGAAYGMAGDVVYVRWSAVVA